MPLSATDFMSRTDLADFFNTAHVKAWYSITITGGELYQGFLSAMGVLPCVPSAFSVFVTPLSRHMALPLSTLKKSSRK